MRGLILFVGLLIGAGVNGQYKSIVYFNDKPQIDNFSLSKPASERRAKSGVTYDKTDFPVNPVYISALEKQGLKVLKVSRWLNAVLVESKTPGFNSDFSFIASIENIRRRKSFLARLKSANDDSLFTDKNFIPHHAEQLYKAGYTGKNMHIAVFDAGFKGVDTVYGFQKLRTENRILYTNNLVGTGNVYQYSNHGTAVLSTMSGFIPNVFRGTASDAFYSLFITEDVASETQAEEFNWAVAAEIADSLGVDVINSSLGYTEFNDSTTNYTHASLDGHTAISTKAAIMAARKGILVVNSAGNSRADKWGKIGAPADADSILTVGAISSDSTIASFSSYGPTADGRIKPDVCALGHRTALINDRGDVFSGNGTSFSSPLMAGLCASFWQGMPELNNQDIRQLILKISDRYNNPDTNFGYGIPDMGKALTYIANYTPVSRFTVFPNPSVNELYVTTGEISGSVKFELFNAIGQLQTSLTLNVEKKSRIQLNELLNYLSTGGTYFLKINSSAGTETKALIIN